MPAGALGVESRVVGDDGEVGPPEVGPPAVGLSKEEEVQRGAVSGKQNVESYQQHERAKNTHPPAVGPPAVGPPAVGPLEVGL